MPASAYALMGSALLPLILWLVQFRLVSENWTGILEWPIYVAVKPFLDMTAF